MSKRVKLPNEPSALIRIAVADLTAVEKMKTKYKINMNTWHEPNGKCKVCFAGSVMAITLKCNPKKEVYIDNFNEDTRRKLSALNYFRCGFVHCGLGIMDLQPSEYKKNDHWDQTIIPFSLSNDDDFPEYEESPKKFKKAMLKLADNLELVGL